MYNLQTLFLNLRDLPLDGWVSLSDQEAYEFKTVKLGYRFGEIGRGKGFFAVVHKETGLTYVGSGVDVGNVVGTSRSNLRNGKFKNSSLQELFNRGNIDDFVVVVIYCSCIKTIYESTQSLMNDFRTRGLCLNNFFKAKTHGADEFKADESVYGCYTLRHKPSGYFYVGTAKNPIGRKYTHLHNLRAGTHVNSTLQSVWNRTEGKDWDWTFVIFGNKEAAYDHEQSIINEHFGKPGTLLLNHSNSARDHINALMTPDVRRRQVEGATTALRTLLSQAIIVDGTEYSSATAAAEALGVNQSTVSRWANNPNNPKAYWKDKGRPEFTEGKVRKVNMWRNDEARKARCGSGNPFAKKIVVKNVTYGSVKEAQAALKIGEKALRKQANDPTNYHVHWG